MLSYVNLMGISYVARACCWTCFAVKNIHTWQRWRRGQGDKGARGEWGRCLNSISLVSRRIDRSGPSNHRHFNEKMRITTSPCVGSEQRSAEKKINNKIMAWMRRRCRRRGRPNKIKWKTVLGTAPLATTCVACANCVCGCRWCLNLWPPK